MYIPLWYLLSNPVTQRFIHLGMCINTTFYCSVVFHYMDTTVPLSTYCILCYF